MKNTTFSAHQISFCPWIGFWKKIYDSDYFDLSIYDQFTDHTWIHYTYIGNSSKKIKWKLPVEEEYIKHHTKYSIKDVKVKDGFSDLMLKQFYDVHHNDKYFEYIYPLLIDWLKSVENLKSLWLINFVLIDKIYNYLQLNTKLAILPYTDDTETITSKIIEQTLSLKCNCYLSGPHGINYLDESMFNSSNIKLIYQDTGFLYENYPQSIVSLISMYGINFVIELLKNH